MAKRKKAIPLWLHRPLTVALRSALTPPLAVGLDPARRAAESLGRSWAGAPFNRGRLQRALDHLAFAMPHLSDEARRDLAVRSYGHLFKLGVEFAYTPRLLNDGWSQHLFLTNIADAVRPLLQGRPCILITGHCGNWELIGSAIALLGFPMAAVYRPLDLKPLDAWVRGGRERLGITVVSKFGAVEQLPLELEAGRPPGFVADQNGGDRGVFVPFFGRLASTYKSIGLLALRFNATVLCGCAHRLEPGEPLPADAIVPPGYRPDLPSLRYVVRVDDVFGPDEWNTHPDPLFYLTARYRHTMERMILRRPEQYLWMHRSWRSRPPHERAGKPFPKALREKLERLPWMTAHDLDRVVTQSERESARAASDAAATEAPPDAAPVSV